MHFHGLQEVKLLWKKISPRDWLNLFQEIAPDRKWTMIGHTQLKCICPYHDDHSPSMQFAFHKGLAKCFSCGKLVVDIVSLVAKLKGCSYTEALLFLHMRFGLDDVIGTNAEELNKYHHLQETKKMAAIAMNKVLQEVLRDNPSHLAYCRPAVHYLRDVRGIPMDILHTLPVGVFAKPEHAKKYISSNLHQLYDEYFAAYHSMLYWGALCFHYNDSPGTISRFRLRLLDRETLPDVNAMAACGDLDSVRQRAMFQKPYVVVDDPYTKDIGIFGLHHYQTMIGNNDTNAYITEGEFDVLSTMAAQDKAGLVDFMLFGTGGNGSTNLSALRDYGILTAWLVPDHPAKNGDTWALNVLGTKANFTAGSGKEPLNVKLFQWPIGLTGMDLDEAVRENGYRTVADYIYRQRNSYFQNAMPWIISKCDTELSDAKDQFTSRLSELDTASETYEVERTNLADERQRAIKTVIMKWFRFVHDPTDRVSYTQRYNINEGIDISQVTEVNNAMYSLNTMEGVSAKVADALQEHFAIAYYTKKSTEPALYAWAKQKEELTKIYTAERALFKFIGLHVGREITDWFDSMLGDNEVYLAGTGKDPLNDNRTKRKNARDILMKALENLIGSANSINSLNKLAQGIHFIDLPEDARRKNLVYFVNGKRIFRGQFTQDDQLKWVRVNNAVDEGTLFENLNRSEQWSFVEDVSDLYAATQVNLKKTYDDIRTVINGWKFEHHKTMATYIAAYIMALPIMRAVGDVNITFITGDAESGKTSFAYGLLGGTQGNHHGVIPILEAGTFSSDATVASMYQTMEGSSLLYVMDEAERQAQNTSSHEIRNQDIFRLLYGLPMGGVTVKRGGVSKEQAVSYFLRMPVLMAAINIPTESTFLSRVLIIYTVKEPGRRSLDLYMQDHFTDDALIQLRRNITVGLLPHIPDIIERRNRLREELPYVSGDVVHVSNRFLDSVLTPLAVYDLIGEDAGALYKDILLKYKDRLEAIHGKDSQSSLLNACLYTEALKVPTQDNITDFVSAKHLILKAEYPILNNSDCGVYYVAEKDWIIIVWRQAKYSILQRTPYIRVEESALREQASKNPYVLPEISREDHEQIKYLLNLLDVKSPAEYTVLEANYLVRTPGRPIEQSASGAVEEAETGTTSEPEEAVAPPVAAMESNMESNADLDFTI